MNKDHILQLVNESVQLLKYILLECRINYLKDYTELKIVIYHQSKKISTNDCALVGGIISRRLEIEDDSKQFYNLVVESPGLEREIQSQNEYSYLLNKEFKVFPSDTENIVTSDGFFVGKLIHVNDGYLHFCTATKETIKIAIENIRKAKLHCDFSKILKEHKNK